MTNVNSDIVELHEYEMAWHPEDGAFLNFGLGDGKWTGWFSVSSENATAIATMFTNRPVYMHREKKYLFTGDNLPDVFV